MRINAVILSSARTPALKAMTADCVRSMRASAGGHDLRIAVVESGHLPSEASPQHYAGASVAIHRGGPFRYNFFCKEGLRALPDDADAYLVSNSDCVYQGDCVSLMAYALTPPHESPLHSVSPWNSDPAWHAQAFPNAQVIIEGYRACYEVCGWSIMTRREVFDAIGMDALLPDCFDGWYQDNYYADQLRRFGFRHALLRDSVCKHLCSKTLARVSREEGERLTTGQRSVYDRMSARLSIIIPTMNRPSLNKTIESLRLAGFDPEMDECIVVGDGPATLRDYQAVAAYVDGPPDHCWGHPQTNYGMTLARGTHIMRMDDDDTYRPGALTAIRKAILEHRDRVLLFRVETPWGSVWNEKAVREKNICSTGIVVPNVRGNIGEWGRRYEGDFDFLQSTLRLRGDEPVFVDAVVSDYVPAETQSSDKFRKFLASASQEVKTWPVWKQSVLGCCAAPAACTPKADVSPLMGGADDPLMQTTACRNGIAGCQCIVMSVPCKKPRVLVAVCVFDRAGNLDRWLRAWAGTEKNESQLVVVDTGGTQAVRDVVARWGGAMLSMSNDGMDIGALRWLIEKPPAEYDVLVWCADDQMPMSKSWLQDFVRPFEKANIGLVANQWVTPDDFPHLEGLRVHARTCAFAVRREVAEKLTFPDPLVTKGDCYAFEWKNGCLTDQVRSLGWDRAAIDENACGWNRRTPLWDNHSQADQNRTADFEAAFPLPPDGPRGVPGCTDPTVPVGKLPPQLSRIIVTDREGVKSLDCKRGTAIISITEPGFPEAELPDCWPVYRCSFFDYGRTWPKPEELMKAEDAEAIWRFVDSLEGVETLAIHCEMGASRSPSVAMAIMAEIPNVRLDWRTGPAGGSMRPPNGHVYEMMLAVRRSGDVPPRSPVHDTANAHLSDSEADSERASGFPGGVATANLGDSILGQLGDPVSGTASQPLGMLSGSTPVASCEPVLVEMGPRLVAPLDGLGVCPCAAPVSGSHSPLFHGIGEVVRLRTKEEVASPDAGGCVASVANEKLAGIDAELLPVRNSAGLETVDSADADFSVPATEAGSPDPALPEVGRVSRFWSIEVNVGPEPGGVGRREDGDRAYNADRHGRLLARDGCVEAPAAPTVGASLSYPVPRCRKLKICTYTIAKNEQQFAKRWADSCRDADGMFILNTGSTDQTVEAFREQGCVVNSASIVPWDFSRGRNAALDLIPGDYDICFSLDADETISSGWRKLLEDAWVPGTTQAAYQCNHNLDGDKVLGAFIRNTIHSRQNHRWTGICHEYCEIIPGFQPQCVFIKGLETFHRPDPKKSRAQYFPMLLRAVEENPNPQNLWNLAREILNLGRADELIDICTQYLAVGRHEELIRRSAVYRWIAAAHLWKKDNFEAERWLLRAVAEAPTLREPWLVLASFQAAQGNYEVAAALVTSKVLPITTKPIHYLVESFAWENGPESLLAKCKERMAAK